MTVKLAILKSGEEIISDIKEGFLDDKMVNYFFKNPCKIDINGSYKIFGDTDEENFKERYSITLSRWPRLSDDLVVSILPDWVVTIVEPNSQLKEMYKNEVLNDGKDTDQDIVFTEQSDSDKSD
jgi:hypothetical protein